MSTTEKRPVIEVTGLKKQYKLGQIGGGTLTHDLQSWWARVRGKEDPNTVIGTDQRLFGQTFMALNGVDLTVYQGEALGIIGRNGAGKSTLLKLLSRITAPTEGEIRLRGRVASMLEVGTGFNNEMTGRENIYMNGAILGMTKAEIDAKLPQIIEFSECGDFIDTPVKRYSSGMFVKLAFSVAAHLDSEIMIMDEVLAVDALAVADAVVALEVRRSLSRRDEVVRGDRVLRVRQGDLDDFRAELLILLDGRAHSLLDFRVHALDKVLLRQADLEALDVLDEGLRVVRHRCGTRRGVHLIVARDDVEQVRAVRDVARQRADLVERGRIGDETVARDAAVRRLHADDTAIRCGLSNGTAGIGTQCCKAFLRCHCRCRAAGGTAGHMLRVSGILCHSVIRSLRGAAHGKLIHIGLAQNHCACLFQIQHCFRTEGRHKIL